MNQSIMLVSDQAEAGPDEFPETQLFTNYTNIPSFNQRQMFHQQYANGHRPGYSKQLEVVRQQIIELKAFQKQISDEIQYLVYNFSYIVELAANNINSKFSVLCKANQTQKDGNSASIRRQQQTLKQTIQHLQLTLKKEQEANKTLQQELAQHKKLIKHQSESLEILKKKTSTDLYPEAKNEVNDKVQGIGAYSKIKKQNSLSPQSAYPFDPLEGTRKINRSVEHRELQKLDQVKEKFQILKRQLECSKQQLLDYR